MMGPKAFIYIHPLLIFEMRIINLLRLTLVLKMCYKNKYYEAAVIDVRDKPGPLHLGEDRLCDMTGAIRNADDGKRLLETTVRFAGNGSTWLHSILASNSWRSSKFWCGCCIHFYPQYSSAAIGMRWQ